MTNSYNVAALPLILLVLCAAVPGTPGQQPAAAAFPEKLLEGAPDFNVAFLIQGDLRGNYGPCG